MANTYLQNVFIVGSDTDGDVQGLDVGKDDNSTPIYFEVETQDLEFQDRTHLKKISDKIVVFTNNAIDSSLEIKNDDVDYKPVGIDLSRRINIGKDIKSEGYFFNFKWYGNSSNNSPVLEGFFLEDVTDLGITQK